MNYWLIKSEPNVYSIDDLQRDKQTAWHGVRNYQVRTMLRDQMRLGDRAYFYHSKAQQQTGIVGMVDIYRCGYPDESAINPHSEYYDPKSKPDNPCWFIVDIKFNQKFSRVITLKELRTNPYLSGLLILRQGSHLSISPVTLREWDAILQQLAE